MKFDRTFQAYVVPFVAFMAFIAAAQVLGDVLGVESKYWLYPLQTVVCAGLLVFYWKSYDWGDWGRVTFGLPIVAGLVVFGLWVAPQELLRWVPSFGGLLEGSKALAYFEPRVEGFDPRGASDEQWVVVLTIIARCMRLMIVVPLVEEIFWRGFLQRWLVKEKFSEVSVGTFSRLSFFGTAVAFMLVHSPVDWPAAFATGLIFGGVVLRTRSVFAAVLAHAVTNVALGIYILTTGQWGFWQ